MDRLQVNVDKISSESNQPINGQTMSTTSSCSRGTELGNKLSVLHPTVSTIEGNSRASSQLLPKVTYDFAASRTGFYKLTIDYVFIFFRCTFWLNFNCSW